MVRARLVGPRDSTFKRPSAALVLFGIGLVEIGDLERRKNGGLIIRKIDKHRPSPTLRVPYFDSPLLTPDRSTLITLIYKALVLVLLPHTELESDSLQALLYYVDGRRLFLLGKVVLLIEMELWRHLKELKIATLKVAHGLSEVNDVVLVRLLCCGVEHFRDLDCQNYVLDLLSEVVLLESAKPIVVNLVEPDDRMLEQQGEVLDYLLKLLEPFDLDLSLVLRFLLSIGQLQGCSLLVLEQGLGEVLIELGSPVSGRNFRSLLVLLVKLGSEEVCKHAERVLRILKVSFDDLDFALKEVVLFATLEEVLQSRVVEVDLGHHISLVPVCEIKA